MPSTFNVGACQLNRATRTPTDTVDNALPPAPVHERLKVASFDNGPMLCVPDVARLPDHAPDAVHDVVLALDQVRELTPLRSTQLGAAANVIVGVAAATVTATLRLPVPPAPVHASANVVLLVRFGIVAEPEVARFPDQPPLAVQLVALVDDQFSVVEPLNATEVGVAVSVTVGVAADTVTVTF